MKRRYRFAFVAVLVAAGAFGTARAASAACSVDAECTAPPLVRCDSGQAGGVCVECLGDGDCKAGLVCERGPSRASFGKCVQCTELAMTACVRELTGATCLSSGACGCATDDDCGDVASLRVCAGGQCAAGCRGDGSRACPAGQSCTARGAGTGSCVNDPGSPVARADAGQPNPTPPPVRPGGGCGVSGFGPPAGAELALMTMLGIAFGVRSGRKRRRRPTTAVTAAVLALAALASTGCSRTPTPLRPGYAGSVGLPHRGVLVGGAKLAETEHLAFLRDNDRRWATERFARVLARAAERVANERPGGKLVVGDLSAKGGGVLLPHLSHRSGRDADLLLYVTTLEGAPVVSPGFVHVREDGLAWDERGKRFLRFDVERQWLLLKALLEDEEAHVQFAFASRTIRSLLAEWAVARGESAELVYRALTVLVQPNPGGEHDDHFHVRTACTDDELVLGCEPSGPERPWLVRKSADTDDPELLARTLFEPIENAQTTTLSSVRGAR